LLGAAAGPFQGAATSPFQQQQVPQALPPAAPRIWLEFQLEGFAANSSAAAQITSDAMPTAVRILQKLFKVRRPTLGALQLPGWWAAPGASCIDARVNRDSVQGYGPGRAADYILYVTSAPCEGGTVAYAGACAIGGPDNRPVMGAINLCPGAYERLGPSRQVEVTVHELLHAFVSAWSRQRLITPSTYWSGRSLGKGRRASNACGGGASQERP
jgi:hypothetical protein